MPPKKKGAKKKKKNDGELTIEEKYKKTLDEIEALKDHLAMRKEMSRNCQVSSADWKSRMQSAEETLADYQDTQRAVSADMTRQYKTMQTEMAVRLHQLEQELNTTKEKLEETTVELQKTIKEKNRMCQEKDEKIESLQMKLDSMGMQYENILMDALDKLTEKITSSKNKWENQSTAIQANNKKLLLEFGLNPLDI